MAAGITGDGVLWAVEKETLQINCGDYNLVTRKTGEYGRGEEELFRINNKTGETWRLKRQVDPIWDKIKEKT